jgi:hypothetical protein
MSRSATHPPSKTSLEKGDLLVSRTSDNPGASVQWLVYEKRKFGELLSDWQESVSPGNPEGFIRDHLHLESAISRHDFINLISGNAIASKPLADFISACVPPHISTPLVMRNRAYTAINRGKSIPQLTANDQLIKAARAAKLCEFASAADETANHLFDSWRTDLIDRLTDAAHGEVINVPETFNRLAALLGIDQEVLAGHKLLTAGQASHVGNQLSQMFGLAGDEFDGFAQVSAGALAESASSVATPVHNNYRKTLRFLTESAGMLQEDLGKRLPAALRVNLTNVIPSRQLLERCQQVFQLRDDEATLLRKQAERRQDELSERFAPVVEHFADDGLTTQKYLKAAISQSALFAQRPETLIGNIEGVVKHFASDGLTTQQYLKAACKQPTLFCQRPETLIGNIEGIAKHFAGDGLTTAQYLKAAVKKPRLFTQRPKTLIGNIEGVANHFASDGLTTQQYLEEACKQPQIFTQRSETLIGNIEGVVKHFADDGLTTQQYLKAAISQPTLFTQRPETLIGNIEGVVKRFASDGLTTQQYLKAAIKRPQLFYQRPNTIQEHIHILQSMDKQGLLPINKSAEALWSFITAYPFLLSLSVDNLYFRQCVTTLTDRQPDTRQFVEIHSRSEARLRAALAKEPDLSDALHAEQYPERIGHKNPRRWVERALEQEEGYLTPTGGKKPSR